MASSRGRYLVDFGRVTRSLVIGLKTRTWSVDVKQRNPLHAPTKFHELELARLVKELLSTCRRWLMMVIGVMVITFSFSNRRDIISSAGSADDWVE